MSASRALDVSDLLAQAEQETGLSDYGDETLPARLALAVEAVRANRLSADGEAEATRAARG